MTFSHIIFFLRLNFNFISFSQLKKAVISYQNHFKNIILKKTRNIIGLIYVKKIFFVLDLENNANKIMIV